MAMARILIIHVGNMNNKGTQALLKTDVSVIKELVRNVTISVSTTDEEKVKALYPSMAIFPPLIDIPYERADFFAKKTGFSRGSLKYKVVAFASLVSMFLEVWLCTISASLCKLGLRPFYRGALLQTMKESDVVVSYSDENFKEGASQLPSNAYWIVSWWTLLLSRTWAVLTVKFLGKPIVMFPNSVGCFRTWVGRMFARLALNRFDRILIREPRSNETVKSLGIRVPRIMTSDMTLLLKASGKPFRSDLQGPVIGVSIGVYSHTFSEKGIWNFVEANAEALDATIEKYGLNVVFLPHNVTGFRHDDFEVSKLVMERMRHKERARIVNGLTVEEFKSYLSQMDMVISAKMHPGVLAVASFVPALCIAYDDKQSGFFEQLSLSKCVISVQDVTAERLTEKIEYVWNARNDIRAKLEQLIPRLQTDTKAAVEQVLAPYVDLRRKE